ncbi:hypothetical protein LCGC14_2180300, partial [marine sediment metagenome]
IIYSNLFDNYTLTASQEDANYPVENVQDIRLAKTWRTITASAASAVIPAGSAALAIFQATTNLVSDPEDLTTGNWTKTNCTASATSIIYDSKAFTKVTNSVAAAGHTNQSFTDTWNNLIISFSAIVRKGSSANNTTYFRIRNDTTGVFIFSLALDWDNWPNAPGTPTEGTLHGYDWKDSETLELRVICDTLIADTDNITIRCYGSNNATANEYTYWTAAQAEDLSYSTPYVNGSRAVTHPDETFELPSQFTIDMIVRPWFVFDTVIAHRFIEWFVDGTHEIGIRYNTANDTFRLIWEDGGTARALTSQQFDDGSSSFDINQRLRILVSIDLTTGTSGSRLIVIPLESGAINEDIIWSGAIDAHTSTFPTLSIGHSSDIAQIDSQIEYIKIYAGTLVGTVADSDDADALLTAKDLILDLTYLNKLTADAAAIVNHNLSADATIKIEGNDYDSWNGPPVSETMTWRAETIVKFITSVSYPFWRFSITDPNVSGGYFEVGRLVLGEYLQIDPSSLVEFPEKHPRSDQMLFSLSNQPYGDEGVEHKELDYRFEHAGGTTKTAIETMWNSCGKFKPLLLMNYDTSYATIPPLYASVTNDIIFEHLKFDKWSFDISLREAD